MSNEPIFEKLAREYATAGKSYERMTAPYLTSVKPAGLTEKVEQAVYAPNEHLDGPYKAPLPKRTVAQLIETPEPDPEFAKKLQEFIQTAPMQILAGTPAGSFISNVDIVKTGDDVILEAEVMVPPTAANYDDIAATDAMFNGLRPQMEIVSMTETVNLEDEEYNLPKFFEGMVKRFREKYPNAQDLSTINHGEGLDGTVTISIEGKTPKQTDESVNAASNDAPNHPQGVTPLWILDEEDADEE